MASAGALMDRAWRMKPRPHMPVPPVGALRADPGGESTSSAASSATPPLVPAKLTGRHPGALLPPVDGSAAEVVDARPRQEKNQLDEPAAGFVAAPPASRLDAILALRRTPKRRARPRLRGWCCALRPFSLFTPVESDSSDSPSTPLVWLSFPMLVVRAGCPS